MAKRGPRLLRWVALGVLAVLLAACSSNPKAAPSSSTSPAASSGASSTSSPSPQPIAYPRSWTIESVDSSGATWTTTVAIANVVSGNALTGYTTLYGDPCGLDPKTDAIVPFQITTTSTKPGYFIASGDQELRIVNASLGVAPRGSDSPKGAQGTQSNAGFAAGEVLKVAENSSSGPTCSNLDPPSETMTLGNDSLTEGQQVVLKGYFDLKHWSGTTHQDGDTSWLPNIWILVPNSGTRQSGKGWETTSVSGPAVVSLLDYTPAPTYNPSDSNDKKSVGYGWVFPIDGSSEPNCASASSNSPSGSSMPSLQSLCEALPEEIVMAYLNNHEEITNAIGRSLTGITSENSMTDVFHSLQSKGEIEMVPGKTGSASAWRKKASE
jgi:hypothetical protein